MFAPSSGIRLYYDFIVCGAGPSVSAVASRLAEDCATRVLLIEAAGIDDAPEVKALAHSPLTPGPECDWPFVAQSNPHLHERMLHLSMEREPGGGFSSNVMVRARGHRNDWKEFAAEAGDAAWAFSIYRAYAQPKRRQSTLTVITHAMVSRLILRGTSVAGVEVIQNGERRIYMAHREVALSLGAINTGTGPTVELRRHGMTATQHWPGIGQNHQDHLACGCIFEHNDPPPVGNGDSEAALYWKSDSRDQVPDLFRAA